MLLSSYISKIHCCPLHPSIAKNLRISNIQKGPKLFESLEHTRLHTNRLSKPTRKFSMGQSNSVAKKHLSSFGSINEDDIKPFLKAYLDSFGDDVKNLLAEEGQGDEFDGTTSDADGSVHHFQYPYLGYIDRVLHDHGFLNIGLKDPSEYLDFDEILPIFSIENVDTTLLGEAHTRKAWDAIRPALALASKFLTAPEARKGFWHRLAFGEETKGEKTADYPSGKPYLAESALERDFSQASKEFDLILQRAAKNISFWFAPDGKAEDELLGCCYGNLSEALNSIDPSLTNKLLHRSDPVDCEYLTALNTSISISSRLLYFLLSPFSPIRSGQSGTWNNANMRFQLYIADLMCHEICHLLWKRRNGIGYDTPREPFIFQQDGICEAGLSWNFYLAGGFLDPLFKWDYVGAFLTTTWRFAASRPRVSAVVDMQWVERWFRKETWAAGVGSEQRRANSLWGKAILACGNPGPKFFVAQRLTYPLGNHDEPEFRDVLYVDQQYMEENFEEEDECNDNGLDVDMSVPLEDWYAAVREEEIKQALEAGYPSTSIVDSWGSYQHLKPSSYDAIADASEERPSSDSGEATSESVVNPQVQAARDAMEQALQRMKSSEEQ